MVAPVLLGTRQKWEGTVWCMAPCFSRAEGVICLGVESVSLLELPE